jgi:hypothetical protein
MILLYWCFAAIANFQRVQQNGKLTKTAFALALPLLVFGFALDYFLNLTVVAFITLDPLYWGTISNRMKKYNNDETEWAWRRTIAKWLEPLLDPLDPSGNHI